MPHINKNSGNQPYVHAMLILDCWKVYRSQEFLQFMETHYHNLHLVFVPAGCTSIAQPADVALQRPLKHRFQHHFDTWALGEVQKSKIQGLPPAKWKIPTSLTTLKPIAVTCIYDAWKELRALITTIVAGWWRAGLDKFVDRNWCRQRSLERSLIEATSILASLKSEADPSSEADRLADGADNDVETENDSSDDDDVDEA